MLMSKIGIFLGYGNLIISKVLYGQRFVFDIRQHIHSGAIFRLDKGARIKLGANICSYNNCKFCAYQNSEIIIGSNSYFSSNTAISATLSIKMGNNCLIGPGVVIVDFDHGHQEGILFKDQSLVRSSVVIGDNVWIGANSVIMRGTRIGSNSVIAAGSRVKGTIPEGSIYIEKHSPSIFKLSQ